MAKLALLFSLLLVFVYTSVGENTFPREPLCSCTINVPDTGCGSCANDIAVKNSVFLALQTKVEELSQKLALKRTGISLTCQTVATTLLCFN